MSSLVRALGLSSIPMVSQSPLAAGLTLLGLVFLGWKIAIFLKEFLYIKRTFNKIPGFPYFGWISWFLGNIDIYFYFLSNMTKERAVTRMLNGMYEVDSVRKHGLVRFYLGPKRMIGFFHQKTVENLITSMENIQKADQYDFFAPWLGDGLLTSYGDHWKRNRKLLTPAFHFKILESFVPVMNENSKIMLDLIAKTIETNPAGMRRDGVDVRPLITNCTLDTICETAMGTRVGAQVDDGQNVDYIGPINDTLRLAINRMLEPQYQLDWIYNLSSNGKKNQENLNKIHTFVRKVINDRRQEVEKSIAQNKLDVQNLASDDVGVLSRKRYAFLDSLLLTHFKDPQNFLMSDIQDEVNTFMFEGHDTTSISLIFTTLLVASDPRVQEKIHEELDSIFDGDQERPITAEDCRQMKYLEMCIKESLRLYPSVPFFARKVRQEFVVNGYTIPKDCQATIFVFMLHRDPAVFPNPEKFIPERFGPDKPVHRMPYAYMPFSAGPRNCIGQKFAMLEMKILLAQLFRAYRLRNITQRDAVDVTISVLIKAVSPIQIEFEKRVPFETKA